MSNARRRTVDDSIGWECVRCPYKHHPAAGCPTPGVWLVLAMCPMCDPKTIRYCSRHGRPA